MLSDEVTAVTPQVDAVTRHVGTVAPQVDIVMAQVDKVTPRVDSNKLNSIKVLVFSKFPVKCAGEKDRLWRFIKTKINARCRASKFATREH